MFHSQAHAAAFLLSVRTGRKLAQEYPKIADMYREGLTLEEIAKEIDLETRYGVKSMKTATMAVSLALGGYEGGFGAGSYEGLMPLKEKKKLAKRNLRRSGKKIGAWSLEHKVGIHAQTIDERRKLGRKSGRYTLENGLGVHGLTEEEIRENSRNALRSRGDVPFSQEEVECAYKLFFNPDYRTSRGANNGMIAETLNEKFHDGKNVRNSMSVKTKLYKHRKKVKAGSMMVENL